MSKANEMLDLLLALTTTQGTIKILEKEYAAEKKTTHNLRKKLNVQERVIKEMSLINDTLVKEKQDIAAKYNDLYNTNRNYPVEIHRLKEEIAELFNANKRLAATLKHTSNMLSNEQAKNRKAKKQRTD